MVWVPEMAEFGSVDVMRFGFSKCGLFFVDTCGSYFYYEAITDKFA
jgi:hypothetical protein